VPEYSDPRSNYPHPKQTVNGVLILVLGILSLTVCGCFTGIPAWIMGNNALSSIRAGIGDPSEEQMANIGRILGMISVALNLCGCIGYAFMMAAGMGSTLVPTRVH
jgi:hypothetical protein